MARSADMPCQELVEQLMMYVEGTLARDARTQVETHCRSCSGCRAYLAETRFLTSSLRRLGEEAAVDLDVDKERLLTLFRTRGPAGRAPREPKLPLGIGNALVAPGDHIAYLWESEQELDVTTDFLVAGLERDEVGVLVGHDVANHRVLAALERRGFDSVGLRREERLLVVSGSRSSDEILRHVDDRIKTAVDRGFPSIRILGNLGWGHPGWPPDHDLLAVEAQTTAALQRLPTVALCAYDVRGLPERILRKGAFECHPWTFRHNVLRPSERHVPTQRFLETLAPETT